MNDTIVKAMGQLIFSAKCGIRSMENEPEYHGKNSVGSILRESVEDSLIAIDIVNGMIARHEESKK